MIEERRSQRGLLVLAAMVATTVAVIGFTRDADPYDSRSLRHDHPSLFGAPPPCSPDGQSVRRATRLERQGHFFAERYPYDPRDGVQAVLRFQEAHSCYQDSGLLEPARRTRQLASGLMARINVDYASSRLVLESALVTEKWSVALSELSRLLRLTEHIGDHAYVEHLGSIVGRVSIHASDDR